MKLTLFTNILVILFIIYYFGFLLVILLSLYNLLDLFISQNIKSIQIDVEDTGQGIAPEQRDKIFDLFFSTKEGGTGVGLTITKQVIEGHGGWINVESNPNQGTTFSILLPTT